MTFWAKDLGKVAKGAGKLAALGVNAIKDAHAKKKAAEQAEEEQKQAEAAAFNPRNSTAAKLQQMGASSDILDMVNMFSDEELEKEEAEERAEERALEKEIKKISKMPMPSSNDVVLQLKDCDIFAKDAEEAWNTELKRAWLTRKKRIIAYAKIHYADNPAFMQYLRKTNQKKNQKIAELQRKIKNQRIHRLVFWGIYFLSAFIVFGVDDILEEWWEWALAIIAYIVAFVIRLFVRVSENDYKDELEEFLEKNNDDEDDD